MRDKVKYEVRRAGRDTIATYYVRGPAEDLASERSTGDKVFTVHKITESIVATYVGQQPRGELT